MMKRLVPPTLIGILLAAACQWGLSDESPAEPLLARGEEAPVFRYDPHGKRNPFVPLILPKEETTPTPTPAPLMVTMLENFTPTPTPIPFPSLEVDCILWFEDRPSLVVIENALLSVGDIVEDCEIVDITPDSIRVRFMGQEKTFDATSSTVPSPRKKRRR